MPELAEVEFYRRQWNCGLGGIITGVELHPTKRVFRGANPDELIRVLRGARFVSSEAHGKQMLFGFSKGVWLAVHLGMTGSLRVEKADFTAGAHDHLLLRQGQRTLVFSDPRCFGRVRLDHSRRRPSWWTALPPSILSPQFTFAHMSAFLTRRAGTPIKAALLSQEGFPGVGNWMADEILWRAGIAPQVRSGRLSPEARKRLWHATRGVCRDAIRLVAPAFGDLPRSWLFGQRWKAGGRCPRDGQLLERDSVGGRTTVWCARCQEEGARTARPRSAPRATPFLSN